ncbi:2Fe-2S iron-sulfur cluster-binding protein [Candidatus Omnitrophota bacterium]
MKKGKMVKITIDGREIQVKEGVTILEAAKRSGIDIPTLCYHEALTPYGACRVCQVEIITPKRSSLITACTYPVWDGLIIKTDSEKVKSARKFIVELLLARCPNVKEIQELAKDVGIEAQRLRAADENEDCILCGLCVRACEDIIGSSAISFINRGKERRIDTPFAGHSEACIGCGACAFVCPTGAIKMEDAEKARRIHNDKTELELVSCKACGARFGTLKELDHIKGKIDIPQDIFELCSNCRRKRLKDQVCSIKGKS